MSDFSQARRRGFPPEIPSLAQLLRGIPPEQRLPAPGKVIDVDAVRMKRIVSEIESPFTRIDVAMHLHIHESAAGGLINRLVAQGRLEPQEKLIEKRRAYCVVAKGRSGKRGA